MSRLVSSTDYCPMQDVPTMEACRDLCLTAPYRRGGYLAAVLVGEGLKLSLVWPLWPLSTGHSVQSNTWTLPHCHWQ